MNIALILVWIALAFVGVLYIDPKIRRTIGQFLVTSAKEEIKKRYKQREELRIKDADFEIFLEVWGDKRAKNNSGKENVEVTSDRA